MPRSARRSTGLCALVLAVLSLASTTGCSGAADASSGGNGSLGSTDSYGAQESCRHSVDNYFESGANPQIESISDDASTSGPWDYSGTVQVTNPYGNLQLVNFNCHVYVTSDGERFHVDSTYANA